MKNLFAVFALTWCACLAAYAADRNVVLNFRAVVGEKPFDCAQSYDGVGVTNSTIRVSDFKFYVEDVVLIDKKGKEIPVSLKPDQKFQTDSVVLLDFENATGECRNGTADLNTRIVGTVPAGKYAGLKFRIGVPEQLNHLDPTKQPSPLNFTRMMWSWQYGYKFARIDMKSKGRPNGWVLHLGSTDCETDAPSGKTTCSNANRPEFSFARFNPEKDVVTVDLKALLAGANVDVNQDGTAAGCMSFPGDSDCLSLFRNLGLSFDGSASASQSFMRPTSMTGR